MASREQQVAERLRGDAALRAVLTGGIYEDATLGDEGIADPQVAPDAWNGGKLKPAAIVRQRAQVPDLGLLDLKRQHASTSQVVEIHLYQAGGSDQMHAAAERIYALLQGHALANAYQARWDAETAVIDAPEMSGVRTMRVDYRIYSIRRPVVAG